MTVHAKLLAGAFGITGLLMSGCSMHGPQQAKTELLPVTPSTQIDAHGSLVYVSESSQSFIDVFRMDGTKIRSITKGLADPASLFVDSGHHLWVTNSHGGNVLEFAKGASAAMKTLDDSGGVPVDVTVCPDGTVYVSNFDSPGSQGGSVAVYAPGSTTITRTLMWTNEGHSLFVACDKAGNVYQSLLLTSSSSGPGIFVVFPRGRQAHAKQLSSIVSQFPGGMKPDAAGNLLIADQLANTITEYTTNGAPTGLSISTGKNDVVGIDVTRSGSIVGGADGVDKVGKTWRWPGGALVKTYSDSKFTLYGPEGFAFDPNITSH